MDPVSFLIQLAVTYLVTRLQQPNGPRNKDLAAGLGDYGVPLPNLFGEVVRMVGVVIAQATIQETVHKKKPVSDYLFGLAGAFLKAVKTYTYSDTLALLLADRTNDTPIEGLTSLIAGGKTIFRASESDIVSETFDADGYLIKRKYKGNAYLKSVTVYGGGFDQVPDPILNASPGVEPQPAYRGSAYVVLEDLQLKEFGNAVPVPIEALVKVKTGQSLADVCEIVCGAAGIDTVHDLSSTTLTDRVVRGYAVSTETSCWDALKPLFPAFGFHAAEVAGQIRFYKRSQALRASIPPDDMGAHIYGEDPPERFNFKRATDLDLPRETGLTFIDPNRDYQVNTATSQRSEGNAKSNVAVTIPLVLTASEGATAAALMHWEAWLGRTQGTFSLTDQWIGLEVGRAYAINVAQEIVPYRILRSTRGANGIIEVEAISDEQVTYTASVAGSSGTDEPPISTAVAATRIIPIDGSILVDADDDFGFYLVAGGGGPQWTEGTFSASLDNIEYSDFLDLTQSAPMGDVTGTLAAGVTTGLDNTLDTTSVLTVVLLHDGMVLESATDAELDAGANLSFVGADGLGEYLQFKTATNTVGSTWVLTNLRRGREGTDYAIASHASGEEFALLTDGGLYRIPATTTASWNEGVWLKATTFNQDEADVTAIAFTNTGEGKRPYSPINLSGSFDGSNNLAMTWTRRSRFDDGSLGTDTPESYEVDIILGGSVVRTIASATPTASYLATDQATDGVTVGGVIVVDVYQINADRGRGHPRRGVFTGPNAAPLQLEDDATSFHLEDGSTPIELG